MHAMEQWGQERPDMDTGFLEMLAAFAMIGQQIEIDFRELAQQIGGDMRVGDLRILLVLRRSGPTYSLRAIDLGRELLVTSGAMTKQIGRLENKALIVRKRSKSRRGWDISLTAKGKKIADQVIRYSTASTMASVLGSFESEEQLEGLRFLERVLGKLEEKRG